MASAQTLSAASAVVKVLHDGQKVENLVQKGAPFLAMLKKNERFFGKNKPIPLQYGNPQGISMDFATAQSNAYKASFAEFTLTRSTIFGYHTISGESMEATSNDKGGFVDLFENAHESLMHQMTREWHTQIFREGGGAIGQVATSGITTTALTLANLNDVENFELGMEIGASTDDGTGSGTDRTGTATITNINPDTGVLTTGSNWTSQISGLTDADYLFREGMQGATLKGLRAWLPATVTSTTFFGLDRTAHSTRLGGIRYDGSGQSIEEAIQSGNAKVKRQGKSPRPKHLFIHSDRMNDLSIALGSKVQYVNTKIGEIGFDGIKMSGGITVYEDFECQEDLGYLLDMETWEWNGLGKCPELIEQDGLKVLRQPSDDGVEMRAKIRGQLSCNAPGYNCVITLPT